MVWPSWHPDLQPDERTALAQRLDVWRDRVLLQLEDLSDGEAASTPLPATTLSVAGVVNHLAHVEDRWFHFRLAGNDMPEPWASEVREDDPDWTFRVAPDGCVARAAARYRLACTRSRAVVSSLPSLDAQAPVPSFGRMPVSLRWVLVHLIAETACHSGHLDLLRDALGPTRS